MRRLIFCTVILTIPIILSSTLSFAVPTHGPPPYKGDDAPQAVAYFEVSFDLGQKPFIIQLQDKDLIRHARDIVKGTEKHKVHVSGIIAKEKASYNPGWLFHLVPASISFFEVAMEVCDAAPEYVDQHLDDVGGSLLPDGRWCPWRARVVGEVGVRGD